MVFHTNSSSAHTGGTLGRILTWAVYGRANAVVNQLLGATVGWRDVTQSRRFWLAGTAAAPGPSRGGLLISRSTWDGTRNP